MKRVLLDYLYDILEAINDIETFLKNTDFKKFQSDNMRRNAVVRSLEIIGEAARNIPEELRSQYKDIPWKRMAARKNDQRTIRQTINFAGSDLLYQPFKLISPFLPDAGV